MSAELTIKGNVQALHLLPGDDVIITLEGNWPREAGARIEEIGKELWPDHRIVILAEGISLSVSRKGGAEDPSTLKEEEGSSG